MDTPRAYTAEEVRDMLLSHIASAVTYWEKESREASVRGKLEGLAFSILATLDGSSVGLPAFIVAPHPHESDEAYHRDSGENWFPPFDPNNPCDLGSLHEHIHKHFPPRP